MKTVKRKANIGERILITNADLNFDHYDNGDVLTVSDIYHEIDPYLGGVIVEEVNIQIFDDEYEVIIEGIDTKDKLRTVKRKAEIGEKILITNAHTYTFGHYSNGDTLTVKDIHREGHIAVEGVCVEELHLPIFHCEYEVIAEESSSRDYVIGFNDGYDEGFAAARSIHKIMNSSDEPVLETQQEERERIVAEAKAEIDELINECNRGPGFLQSHIPLVQEWGDLKVYFVVNKAKRTIVALVKTAHIDHVVTKGIAKCNPDDCFNTSIGKIIALRRALGLKVLNKYAMAPLPTEVKIGDIIEYRWIDGTDPEPERREVVGFNGGDRVVYETGSVEDISVIENRGEVDLFVGVVDDSGDGK